MKTRTPFPVIIGLMTSICGEIPAQPAPRLLPFQGRLTDPNGAALTDGVRVTRFRIFDDPTSAEPLWPGELHRATINGGLVNVQLGSKTPFTGVDFDRQLYLEITVDSNGDSVITAEDPPILPRQAILPVLFAKEAGDSRTLDGHDWSSVFSEGAMNPATARISGDRIVAQSVTAAQMVDGAVTLSKLAIRQVDSSVGVGGVAVSNSVTNFTSNVNSYAVVPGLSVSIETTGRPVLIMLVPGLGQLLEDNDAGVLLGVGVTSINAGVGLYRDGSFIQTQTPTGYNPELAPRIAVSSFRFLDLDVPPGRHSYSIRLRSFTEANLRFDNVRLVAFEF